MEWQHRPGHKKPGQREGEVHRGDDEGDGPAARRQLARLVPEHLLQHAPHLPARQLHPQVRRPLPAHQPRPHLPLTGHVRLLRHHAQLLRGLLLHQDQPGLADRHTRLLHVLPALHPGHVNQVRADAGGQDRPVLLVGDGLRLLVPVHVVVC